MNIHKMYYIACVFMCGLYGEKKLKFSALVVTFVHGIGIACIVCRGTGTKHSMSERQRDIIIQRIPT